jgi:hypothetical protein
MTRQAPVAASSRLDSVSRQATVRSPDFGSTNVMNLPEAGSMIAASGERRIPGQTSCNKTISHKRAEFD